MVVYVEENVCAGIVPNLSADLVIDNCSPLDTVFQQPWPGTLFGAAHGDMLEVVLTVVDVNGNIDTCGVTLTLVDTIAPTFLNCPQPDIKVNTLPGMCAAFVNFTLPLATDNCGPAGVVQTDGTGLTTGDMFPVGTTIVEFTAFDDAGNSTVCTQKIIVNDKATPEPLDGDGCPEDLTVVMDPAECGAVVENITPSFTDNCEENLSVIYQVSDLSGNELFSGLADASGSVFDQGTSVVTYLAQDQPLLLITEVTHEWQAGLGSTDPVPDFLSTVPANADFLEVTNFGPAAMDVSCLNIERLYLGGSDVYAVPSGVVLLPGQVLTIHFGEGTDDPANHFFNVPGATELPATQGAAYVISHSSVVLDVVVLGDYNPVGQGSMALVGLTDWVGTNPVNSGGLIRHTVWDSNGPSDYLVPAPCYANSIGSLNPTLPVYDWNGHVTALQAKLPNRYECTFHITVEDHELPQCGMYGDYQIFTNDNATDIELAVCESSVINIPNQFEIADLNVYIEGNTESFGDLSFTLISPTGVEVVLADAICGTNDGWQFTLDSDAPNDIVFQCFALNLGYDFAPINSLEVLNGTLAQGDWILQVSHNGGLSDATASLLEWRIEVSARLPFYQESVVINNEPGDCSAVFEWNHPVLFDNCPGGEMQIRYLDESGAIVGNGSVAEQDWGTLESYEFPVGVTTVVYLLTDGAENISECSFTVEVLDVEPPVLECPEDVTIQLGPEECGTTWSLDFPVLDDNCGILTIDADPPLTSFFEIGTTEVNVTIADAAGNSVDCSFNVIVLEFEPVDETLACFGEINVSLGPDCVTEITADMILLGDNHGCYENYEVIVCYGPEPGGAMIPTSPFITLNEVGQQLVVKICIPETEECCWGLINVDFYEIPEFICPVDVSVSCNEDTSPENLGQPIITSCVPGGASVSYDDVIEDNGDCEDPRVVISRTWTVSDGVGNSSECIQTITIEAFDLADIDFPPNYDNITLDALDCAAVINDPGLTHPDVTGYPTVDGSTDVFGVNYCSASYLWTDEVYAICPGSYEILRTWKVLNTCLPVESGENPLEHIQVIKVLDQSGPLMDCPENMTVSTGPFGCTATFVLPDPGILESCSNATFTASVNGGVVIDYFGDYVVSNLPIGTFTVTYTATDECLRTSQCSFEVTVEDMIEPIAICDDELQISIGGEGYARIYAEDVDEGSHDNCSEVSLQVRRVGGQWGDYAEFDCDDINEFVVIQLLVEDAAGNTNMCWLEILVEDKTNPFCYAPHSTSLHCDDEVLLHIDWDDVDQLNETFGEAWSEDNCNGSYAEQIGVTNNLNDCGWGTVIRTFRAVDDWGLISQNACQQVITVYEVHNYEIKFPKDTEAECGIPNPDTIDYNTLACDLITVNVNDEIYEATSDECYKILRTYKVINWCEWDGESAPVVIGRDEDCDGNPGDEDVWVTVRTTWNGNDPIYTTYVDRDNDETNLDPFEGTSRCTNLPKPNGHWANSTINLELTSIGHWQYTQVIKVYDYVAPTVQVGEYNTFCSESADCTGDVAITFTVEELCDLDVVIAEGFIDAFADGSVEGNATVVELSRDEATSTITYEISGTYPLGNHSFGIHVEDGCENVVWVEVPFEVVDCKAPTPICINGLTVTLMPQPDGCCSMAIWATDFIASPIEDCSGPVTYSIHRVIDVDDGTEIPAAETTGLVLDCNDEEEVMIYIYAWDNAFNPYAIQPDGSVGGPNYDRCETYVLVQAHESCVTAASMIAGIVETEETEGVEGVELTLSGNVSLVEYTTDSGHYFFDGVENGFDYTITPHLDSNPLNGVTTFDLILISKHILSIQLLDSPYKLIAADANASGTITTADMIQLRKLILGLFDELPNNTSWRFVDADYLFPDPANPWSEEFPETRNINDLAEDMLDENFIAVKIGDVNLSAAPNSTSVEERNVQGLFTLRAEELRMKAGEQYNISFTAADLKNIQGYQFTFNFDRTALSFEGMDYDGLATADNFGLAFLEQGMITASWNLPGGQTLNGDEVLFTLRFTAQRNVLLSEVISIGSTITRAEAYSATDELLDLALSFEDESTSDIFAVYQNTPNPFDGSTRIGYTLPEDAAVTITIQDVTGKTLKVLFQDGQQGYNVMVLEAKTLGATGTLYYTVATDTHIATKKMIVVE